MRKSSFFPTDIFRISSKISRLFWSVSFIVMGIFSFTNTAFAQLDLDFETDRGYYTTAFNLELTVNDPSATIRFTTNGDKPTPNSGTIYTSPIPINTTSYIRAIAYASFDTTKVLTHTFVFPADVINQPNTKTGFPSSNFAFDSTVTNHPTYGPIIEDALSNSPSLSLVMPLNDFKDVHDLTSPIEYETSVEVILPNGEKGYQANGGIERAGGSSFNSAKRNFRLSFKSIYGDSKFDYPLFGKEAAESFDQIALKPGFHGCMNLGINHRRGGTNDLADQVIRDLQGSMSEDGVSISSTFMHVYINGIYWGVYNPSERGNNSFAESYYGGDKDDYDSVKGDQVPGNTYPTPNMSPTDGNLVAWNTLINMASTLDLSIPSNYEQIQEFIEPAQFADYVILTNFGPHADDHRSGKNSFATRDRTGTDGFRFWMWDTEPSLGHYWTWNVANFGSTPYNPLFMPMLDNSDFKTLVGDRVQCHCFEDGALTVSKTQEAYDEVFNTHQERFVAEAARWATSVEYDAFLKKRDTIVNDYLSGRTDFLVNLYRTNGVYPSIDGVNYNQFGGIISQSFPITLSNPNGSGTIYYTTDNTDPKTTTGGISATAQTYNGSFTLSPGVYTVKARVKSGSTWSAMCPTTFYVDQNYGDLVINEIHYNPNDFLNPPDTTSGRNFEFIEIKNCGSEDVNMRDMFFEKGIRLIIEEDLIIPPNGFAVFAEDDFWFQQRYGFFPDARYAGKLDNGGENLWLASPDKTIVDSLDYNDNPPWPATADKGFYSLALLDCNLNNADPASWSIQSVFTTPNAENFFTNFGVHPFSGIVINEIHYNPMDSIVPGTTDTINGRKFEFVEIKNISTIPIDLSGAIFARGIDYEFDNGTIIQPGDFIVLAEDKSSFQDRYGFQAFDKYGGQLDNGGETLWLVNQSGVLLDAVTYDDVFPWDFNADGGTFDYSLALVNGAVDNDTYLNWSVQCNLLHTPGAENDLGCFTGLDYSGLTINEFDYRPNGANDLEFIEIVNNGFLPIDLEALRFSSGITYDFNGGILLPGQFYLIARDSILFQNTYSVAVDGQWIGGLSSNGETITLSDLFGNTIDKVSYGASAPWTNEPVQGVKSLALIDPNLDNNNGANWCVQQPNRTPKAHNTFADADNDGIVDCIDSCPTLNDSLIGSACNDGNVCTTGETWDTNCNCSGGVFQDSDNDGVCDAQDQCTGIDDGLIGTSCNDGDPCTVGETYNASCQCAGGTFADSDNDGICDANDQCPGFNDHLIGLSCDDGDTCTPLTVYSDCGCAAVENAALNGTASMISQLSGMEASRLIDGVTTNNANSGLAHTAGNTTTDWVQIDLGSNIFISTVAIHNRTSCCSNRLSNVYVMVADTPFPINADLNQAINNADFIHQLGDESDGAVTGVNISLSGRYVRLQKSGNNVTNVINLKEIEVFTPYTIQDADNDGVCDIDDVCLGFDDTLIGTSCDDNDSCTTNDLYTTNCDCVGTAVGDSDGDGVCNTIDQCPNFDNNLIGTPCDDGIICFEGSTWDANCGCSGGAYADSDGDGVCNALDQCPGSDDNIDVNGNGIPDACENCMDYITESSNSIISADRAANVSINTNGRVFIGDIEYHAGQEINFSGGFEVKVGAVFHAYIAPCN